MNIKNLIIAISVLIIFSTIVICIDIADGREKRLPIKSLNIQFDKTDAIFTINFDFDKISNIYFLVFGTKTLEPKIRSVFSNFHYDIIKIGVDKAILKVKNVSRFDNGYYLHDSQKFGDTIDIVKISVVDTPGPGRTYYKISATPNYFYR